MDTEVWLPLPGYEGIYIVSSMGNFRRIAPAIGARLDVNLRGGTMVRGYRIMRLCRTPKDHKTVKVSRIIATVFVGAAPSEKHQVNHKNGVRSDDRAENLEWVTPSENVRHRFDVLGISNPRGEGHNGAKLNDSLVGAIKAAKLNGASYGMISKHYGVTVTHAKAIVAGRLWGHVSPTTSDITGSLR